MPRRLPSPGCHASQQTATNEDGGRSCKGQATWTGDDENSGSKLQRPCHPASRAHIQPVRGDPAAETKRHPDNPGKDCDDSDDGNEVGSHHIRDLLHRRTLRLTLSDDVNDLVQHRLARNASDLYQDRCVLVDRSREYLVANPLLHWPRFAGESRLVKVALSLDDDAVRWRGRTMWYTYHVAEFEQIGLDVRVLFHFCSAALD